MKKFTPSIFESDNLSGYDVGQAYLYNLVTPVIGADRVPESKLLEMLDSLENAELVKYHELSGVYDWVLQETSVAQSFLYQAKATALELLNEVEQLTRAEEARSNALKAPITIDYESCSEYTLKQVEGIIGAAPHSISSATVFLDCSDLLNIAVYSHYREQPNKKQFLEIQKLLHNNAFVEAVSEQGKEISTSAKRLLKQLENKLAALPLKEKADELALTAAELRELQNNITDRLHSKAKPAKPPARLVSAEWYKALKAQFEKAISKSDASIWPGALRVCDVYYCDYCGFFSMSHRIASGLADLPRDRTTAGVMIIDVPSTDDRINVIIDETTNKPFDLLVNPGTLREFDKSGLLSLSDSIDTSHAKRDSLRTAISILAKDIEELNKYNALIDIVCDITGVDELKALKVDFTPLETAVTQYNTRASLLMERVDKPQKPRDKFSINPNFIYFDDEERKERLKAIIKHLPAIKVERKSYPDKTIRRIKQRLADFTMFQGASSRIYALFEEGEST